MNKCKNCGYSQEEHRMYGMADVPYCYKFEEISSTEQEMKEDIL